MECRSGESGLKLLLVPQMAQSVGFGTGLLPNQIFDQGRRISQRLPEHTTKPDAPASGRGIAFEILLSIADPGGRKSVAGFATYIVFSPCKQERATRRKMNFLVQHSPFVIEGEVSDGVDS
jgi:hypothetical protein